MKTKSCWTYSPNIHIIKISPGVVFVPRHVSTREMRREHFQESPLHRNLQKSTRLIRDEGFTA